MSTRTRRLVVITVALLGLVGSGIWFQRSRTRSALERYKAELRANGEKLTFEELGVGRARNVTLGTTRPLAAAARLPGGPISPGSIGVMEYVSAGRARVAWTAGGVTTWAPKPGSMVTNDWRILDEQMASAEATLREIWVVVGADPDSDWASDWAPAFATNLTLNPFIFRRNAAHWLTAATIVELHGGRLDRALTNLHALLSLTQFHPEEMTLVNQMIRIGICGLGFETTWEALQANSWTDAQLATMQRSWQDIDLLVAVEQGFLGERALFAERVKQIREGKIQDIGFWPVGDSLRDVAEGGFARLVWQPAADELLFLQNMQIEIGGIRSLKTGKSWLEVRAELDKNQTRLDLLASSRFKYRYLISIIATPNMSRAIGAAVRNETQRQLTLAAIAIRRYELRHGQPPPSLAALVPEFLSTVPHDYMNGQPLSYRINTDRSFMLYSVGVDGKDDGGDPRPNSATNSFGLWQGRDAVWPTAVLKDNPAPAR